MNQVPHPLQVWKGEGKRPCFPHTCCHKSDERNMACALILKPSGPACQCPCEQQQLHCTAQVRCKVLSPESLSRQGAGPGLPSAAAGEGWGQLCTPLTFLSLVVLGATGINTVRDNIRAINLNIGPGSSPGPDIIMALGGNQTTYLSPLLSGSTSSDMLLPTENTPPLSNNTQYICSPE